MNGGNNKTKRQLSTSNFEWAAIQLSRNYTKTSTNKQKRNINMTLCKRVFSL